MNGKNYLHNLKRNWYFPISTAAFCYLNAVFTKEYYIGMLIAFLIAAVIAVCIPSLLDTIKQNKAGISLLAFFTACGICWKGQEYFQKAWSIPGQIRKIAALLSEQIKIADIATVASIVVAVLAFLFVYFFLSLFFEKIRTVMLESGLFAGIKRIELFVYASLFITATAFTVYAFMHTDVFYGTEYWADIVYTSDSPHLVKDNVYMTLMHPENDLRQPLFAVFAAPFTGIFYLFGKLPGVTAAGQAVCINVVQIFLLFLGNFMLAKAMKLEAGKRICFMLLLSSTYTQMLSVLMMEQYVVAYFWLMFCLYLLVEKKTDRMVFWGAGGTLLTGMVLLPFLSKESPLKKFKTWMADIVKAGAGFVVLMLLFCRFDVFYGIKRKIDTLKGFAGQNLDIEDKCYQYTTFVRNCFTAPHTEVDTTSFSHISWQLIPVEEVSVTGVVLLLLAVISVVLNVRKSVSCYAFGWVLFSAAVLVWFGWGTRENGLILYSLYFGWAFFVLLFQLVEWIGNKLDIQGFLPLLSVGCFGILLLLNISAMIDLVEFGITNFPVEGAGL